MRGRRSAVILLPFAALLARGTPAAAQEAAPAPYRPGLGDLMTMTIQPRHVKLALAGKAGNWGYAAFELGDLQEAFDRAAGVWPAWRSIPVGEMMRSVLKDPMAALAGAIKAKDAQRFAAAYQQLTAACNSCHQAADRAAIVIRVPESDVFPDQDFRPAPP
ncbi:MAG TPA: hypothetical protein VLV50_05730 [Stellaceae bacterium]|nr:hypothetical protein [Stellaceae bacterium]